MKKDHITNFFKEVSQIASLLNKKEINKFAEGISSIKKKKGRLFFLGVGGSAGNCSHAVNDFRKLCKIESYAPSDNVSELTARTNDEGWDTVFTGWLKVSNLKPHDGIIILSVGGGNLKKNVSTNLINAIKFAKKKKLKIFCIVGRKDGYAFKNSNFKICIPSVNKKLITPHTEAFQAVIWHCLVSHPKLQENKTKW
tara:strand:- start:71 stop:661 length:591 start_codon:yes stop_codon:yes gene_type:complete